MKEGKEGNGGRLESISAAVQETIWIEYSRLEHHGGHDDGGN